MAAHHASHYDFLMREDYLNQVTAEFPALCNRVLDYHNAGDSVAAQEAMRMLMPKMISLPTNTWSALRKTMDDIFGIAKKLGCLSPFIDYIFERLPGVCQIKFEALSVTIKDLKKEQLDELFVLIAFALEYQDLASVLTSCINELRMCTRGEICDVVEGTKEKKPRPVWAEDYTQKLLEFFIPNLFAPEILTRTRSSELFFQRLLKGLTPSRYPVVYNMMCRLIQKYTLLESMPQSDLPLGVKTKLTSREENLAVALCLCVYSRDLRQVDFVLDECEKWGMFSCHPDLSRVSLSFWFNRVFHKTIESSLVLKRVFITNAFSGNVNNTSIINTMFRKISLHQLHSICLELAKMSKFPRVTHVMLNLLAENISIMTAEEKLQVAAFTALDDINFQLGHEHLYIRFHSTPPKERGKLVNTVTQLSLGYRMLTKLFKTGGIEQYNILYDLDFMRGRVERLLQAVGSPSPCHMASIAAVKQFYTKRLEAKTAGKVSETVLIETINYEFADVIINTLSAFALMVPRSKLYKKHFLYIINTTLRVQDKRIVNEGLELLKYHLSQAKAYEKTHDFALNTIIMDVLDLIYDLYIQPQHTCRGRAFWGVCMMLLRMIDVPQTRASYLSTTIKFWATKRDHDVVLIRFTKLLCAYTKNSAFDMSKYYSSIIRDVFTYAGSNTEVISLFANLLTSIYSRVLKNELIVTPLFTFLQKHGSLFYWTIHYIMSDERLPNLNGPLATILLSALQRLAVIDYNCYDTVVQADLKRLVHSLALQLKNPNVKFRDMVQNVIVQMIPTCTDIETLRVVLSECGWTGISDVF